MDFGQKFKFFKLRHSVLKPGPHIRLFILFFFIVASVNIASAQTPVFTGFIAGPRGEGYQLIPVKIFCSIFDSEPRSIVSTNNEGQYSTSYQCNTGIIILKPELAHYQFNPPYVVLPAQVSQHSVFSGTYEGGTVSASDGERSYVHIEVMRNNDQINTVEIFRNHNCEGMPFSTQFFNFQDMTFASDNLSGGVLRSTRYYYSGRMVDSRGNRSSCTEADDGYIGALSPLNVTVSQGTFVDRVRITWESVSEIQGYSVFRSTQGYDGPYQSMGLLNGAEVTSFDDTDVENTLFAHYIVRGIENGLVGVPTFPIYGYRGIRPARSITASDGDYSDFVLVSWEPSPDAGAFYEIYGNSDCNGSPIDCSRLTSTSCTYDASSHPGQIFTFAVRAVSRGTEPCGPSDTGYAGMLSSSSSSSSQSSSAPSSSGNESLGSNSSRQSSSAGSNSSAPPATGGNSSASSAASSPPISGPDPSDVGQCTNGIDDDGDGATDRADSECSDNSDPLEGPEFTERGCQAVNTLPLRNQIRTEVDAITVAFSKATDTLRKLTIQTLKGKARSKANARLKRRAIKFYNASTNARSEVVIRIPTVLLMCPATAQCAEVPIRTTARSITGSLQSLVEVGQKILSQSSQDLQKKRVKRVTRRFRQDSTRSLASVAELIELVPGNSYHCR